MKLNATTPVNYYAKSSSYVVGTGQTASWSKVLENALFAVWKGGYGDAALAAEAVGVSDMATIRTFYHPTLFEKLQKQQVVVIKNADAAGFANGFPVKENPNVYELWGGVDNVDNLFMEFRVRRYQGK